jgi:Zn-dependent protease
VQTLSFRVLGFQVNVRPGFLMLLGIYGLFSLQAQEPLLLLASWCVVVFLSILLHELGHAVVSRRLGLQVGAIEIHGFGGHVTHQATTPANQLMISLAGPGAGFLIGLPLLGAQLSGWIPDEPIVQAIVRDLIWVNVGWGVVNLLPMMPLDGGNALRSFLALRTREGTAWKVTAAIGAALGIGLAVWGYTTPGVGIFLLFIGGWAAWHNIQILQRLQGA